jgi:hypothetical protein
VFRLLWARWRCGVVDTEGNSQTNRVDVLAGPDSSGNRWEAMWGEGELGLRLLGKMGFWSLSSRNRTRHAIEIQRPSEDVGTQQGRRPRMVTCPEGPPGPGE